MRPVDPLSAGPIYESTSDIRKEVEKLDALLEKQENEAEDIAESNYVKALSFGMTPEYIEAYNMLIGK